MSSYVLQIDAVKAAEVVLGALGRVSLEAGTYFYVGSARRGLAARIARHRRRDKVCRWHIDYLLSREEFRVASVWVSETRGECELARSLGELPGVTAPVPGCGSSDCRCRTHLLYYCGLRPRFSHLYRKGGLRLYEFCLARDDSKA